MEYQQSKKWPEPVIVAHERLEGMPLPGLNWIQSGNSRSFSLRAPRLWFQFLPMVSSQLGSLREIFYQPSDNRFARVKGIQRFRRGPRAAHMFIPGLALYKKISVPITAHLENQVAKCLEPPSLEVATVTAVRSSGIGEGCRNEGGSNDTH